MNNNNIWFRQSVRVALFVVSTLAISTVQAGTPDPVEMLYNFQATGHFQSFDPNTGQSTYVISAVGRAPKISGNGIIRHRDSRDKDDDDFKVVLTDAAITFDAFNPNDPNNPPTLVNFSCQGCKLTYPDGSTFTSDPSVPLEGRAFFLYGPVAPKPGSSIMTVRMAGCSGLRETAGVGKLANKVGSICFNGVFDFDVSNPNSLPPVITGASNCTIVTHSPAMP